MDCLVGHFLGNHQEFMYLFGTVDGLLPGFLSALLHVESYTFWCVFCFSGHRVGLLHPITLLLYANKSSQSVTEMKRILAGILV